MKGRKVFFFFLCIALVNYYKNVRIPTRKTEKNKFHDIIWYVL